MILRPYQYTAIDDLRAEMRRHKSVLLQLATGAGKCLGKGTPILMFDGSIKNVEDVLSGDKLMGPDSRPRKVLSICQGKEEMFQITPTKGEPFICNKSHILSLKKTFLEMDVPGNWFPVERKLLNISVEDYIKKDKTFKHVHKLWRTGVEFSNRKILLPLTPYFLGAWLGDGTTLKPEITSMDSEVILSLYEECHKYGLFVSKRNAGGCSFTYTATTLVRRVPNPIMLALKQLKVHGNKHLPMIYKTSSRKDRLEMLAGLMDTDGSLSKTGYDYVSKLEVLADDVCYIARSLGLAAYKSKCTKMCYNNGVVGDYYRVSITGNCDEIPCRIPRKVSKKRGQKKDVLVTGFQVKSLGEGDYYGFEIDGGDGLFLLGDFTVSHNTALASSMVKSAFDKGSTVFFLVHRKDLIKQTAITFDEFGIPYSYIAAGKPHNPFSKIFICGIDTLRSRLDKSPVPQVVFVDECHMSGSESWGRIIKYYKDNGAWVIGLSATPVRTDGKGLGRHFKSMVSGPSIRWLIDNSFLSDYKMYAPSQPDLTGIKTVGGDFAKDQLAARMDGDVVLIGDAIRHYRKHADGKRCIAYCVSRKHSENVAQKFRDAGIPAQHIDGETPMEERARIIAEFADGKILILTNVALVSTGFDLAAQVGRDVTVEGIIDLSPTKSLSLYLQKIGRALRYKPYPAILLDHAGNCGRHGLPDSEREWTLSDTIKKRGAQEKEATIAVRQCPICHFAFKPAPQCPACEYVFPINYREVDEIEGELEEIKAVEKKEKRQEVGMAKTIDDLRRIQKERGYAPGWVHQMARVKRITG